MTIVLSWYPLASQLAQRELGACGRGLCDCTSGHPSIKVTNASPLDPYWPHHLRLDNLGLVMSHT